MAFYHDKTHDVLIYPVPAPHVRAALPEGREINGRYFAVPRTLRACQVLRYYDHAVPPLITDENYQWPAPPGKIIKPHQKVMANFDVLHRRCFNLSEPGTQKTLAKLCAVDWLMEQNPSGTYRCLIVCPMTIMETVWQDTIFSTFLGRRTVEILHGSADKRKELLAKKPDFAIINFDGVVVGAHTRGKFVLDGLSKMLAEDQDIKIVIIDEVDNYCDARTRRSRVSRLVFGHKPYLLVQTGTPAAQAPTDTYGIAKLVNNAFGKSWTGFRNDTMVQVSNFKWVPRPNGYEKAFELLKPAIRFSLKEVWDDAPEQFPPQQRKVDLTPDQEKALKHLKNDLHILLKSGRDIAVENEGVARLKFLQIVQGAVYDEQHKTHFIDARPRYEEIISLIRRSQRKVIIYAGFTHVVDLLAKIIGKHWPCAVLNGLVDRKDRPTLIRSFSTDDKKVMIADPQVAGHGINEFVVADTAIWVAPIDKVRLYIQGNGRVHRPGQEFPVSTYQIVSTKLEQEMFRRLANNISLQGALLDAVSRGEI